MDEDKYAQVIHDCALELDLQILPSADDTKAGLRGINLSGGQRQRVNVARAAYFDGDLVLLDNALSALDHHTAHHIFQNLLKETMRDKAIILITHQVCVWGEVGGNGKPARNRSICDAAPSTLNSTYRVLL